MRSRQNIWSLHLQIKPTPKKLSLCFPTYAAFLLLLLRSEIVICFLLFFVVINKRSQKMGTIVGYRFYPNDEELVNFYLPLKIHGYENDVQAIAEVDIYNLEPWQLPMCSKVQSDDPFWFFFCRPDYKYTNSRRTSRTTKAGFWKVTGKDRQIRARDTNQLIGTKKTLVFYEGRVTNGKRTSWVMHEYHPAATFPGQRALVICRIKKKADETTCDQGEPSNPLPAGFENHVSTSEINPQLLAQLRDLLDMNGQDFNFRPEWESEMQVEQSTPPRNLPFTDGSSNVFEGLQSQFNTLEGEEEITDFVNSLLDQDKFQDEEIHILPNDSSPPSSLRRLYAGDSSDTETENSYARYFVAQNSSLSNGHATPRVYKQMVAPVPNETVSSSNLVKLRKRENKVFRDEIDEMDASSVHSVVNTPYTINYLRLGSEEPPDNLRIGVLKGGFLSSQGNVSPKAVPRAQAREPVQHVTTVDLPQKKKYIAESNKNWKVSQELSLTSRSSVSAGSNKKGSFTFLETHPLNHTPNPPSVYFVNLFIGVILFLGVIWEVVLLH